MKNKIKRKIREKIVKTKVFIEKNQNHEIIKPLKKTKDFLGKIKKDKKSNILKFDKIKLIYFPIHKNASSYLMQLFDFIETGKKRRFSFNPERHDFFKNKYGLKKKEKIPKDYLSIAFVRNPYERILSAYINKIKNCPKEEQNKRGIFLGLSKDFYKEMDFKEFLECIEHRHPKKLNPHFKPQFLFLVDKNNKIIPKFIGKVEKISDELNKLAKQLNVIMPEMEKKNKNKNYNLKHYYTPELKERVYKIYKKDFDLFNYRRGIIK